MPVKILIVEDNDMNLDMLSRRLERKGFAIVSARDGKSGVEAASRERPNLILMDMSLPVMDGSYSVRRLDQTLHRASPIPSPMATAARPPRW